MNEKRLVGSGFIGLAFIVTLNNLTITGAVVGSSLSNFMGFIALAFFVVGTVLVLQSGLEERVISTKRKKKIILDIDQTLRMGKVGTYRDLEQYAKSLGYEIREGGNHKSVYDKEHLITQIPRHRGDVPIGLYRDTLKKLRDYVLAAT